MKRCICLQGEENRGDPAGFEPAVERDTVLSVIITGSSMLHLPGCYKKSVETCSDIKNIDWDFPSEDPEKHPLSCSQTLSLPSEQAVSCLGAAHDTVNHHVKMLS